MPWPELRPDDLRHFPLETSQVALPVLHPTCRTTADGWRRCIDALLAIRELTDDWDGQGTAAPTAEVVDSATILAVMLRRSGVRPPTVTVQGLDGDVAFEWQWADQTSLILDVDEPFSARLTRITREGVVTEHPLFEEAVAN